MSAVLRFTGALSLLLAGLVGGLIWSYGDMPPYHLAIGTNKADAYISGFYNDETAAYGAFTYRWTRKSASITIPAVGHRDTDVTLTLSGMGRGQEPLPSVTVIAGGTEIADLHLNEALMPYVITIPARLIHDGNLKLDLKTTTFQAPNDSRKLGVIMESVQLQPHPGSPPALPPLRLTLQLVSALAAVALILGVLLARPVPALAVAGLFGAALVALSRFDRHTLGMWAMDGSQQIIFSGLVVLAGFGLTRLWIARRMPPSAVAAVPAMASPSRYGQMTPVTIAGLLWLILWAVALTTLLGVDHPMFRSSDLTMNVHRLEAVAKHGQWLFTLALPGKSALPAPYPPAMYAMLLPFYPFVADDFGMKGRLITTLGAGSLMLLSSVAFIVGTRVAGATAGLWAALLAGFAPAGYLLVSQGNFPNIFAQGVAGLALVALVIFTDWRRPLAALLIVAALGVAVLGHFGVFLTLLLAVPTLALATATLQPYGRRQAAVLLALFALVLAIAFALYYRHYIDLVSDNAQRILAARSGEGEDLGWHAGLGVEWRRTLQSFGWFALPLGLAGIVGLVRLPNQAARLTLGWLGASAIFAAVAIILGLSVRYHFFAITGLAVAGAVALNWLCQRGRLGILAASLIGVAWVGSALAFWYTRITTYLH